MRKVTQNLETLMQTGFLGAHVVKLHESGEFCLLVLMIMTMMMNIKLVEGQSSILSLATLLGRIPVRPDQPYL